MAETQEDEMATGEEIAGGLMEKAFSINPECRKTFKIPQGRRGPKPKLCPECREAGVKVGNVAEKPEEKPARKPTAKKPAAKRKRPAGKKPHHTEIEKPAPAIPTQEELKAECICDDCENADFTSYEDENVCKVDNAPLTGDAIDCIHYKCEDPRPAPEDYRPPIKPLVADVELTDLLKLVPDLRVWKTDMEAKAYLEGFWRGRAA